MSLLLKLLNDPESIVTIDFETYYAVGYSLTDKNINMSEYVRHSEFKPHCLGIKFGTSPVRVFRWRGNGYEDPRNGEIVDLARLCDWSNKLVLAHNTAFDGFILSDRYGIHPAGYLDTLSMSRALYGHHVSHKLDDLAARLGLGSKIKGALGATKGIKELPDEVLTPLMEYCGNDVELCYNAFIKLYPSFPDVELRLVDQTLRMFCRPLLMVDEKLAGSELDKEVAKKETALKTVEAEGITREQLVSNQKFAALLVERGIPVPQKKSKTTGKITFAFAKTDPEFIMRLDDEEEAVRNLFRARLALKTSIGETRAKRLLTAGSNSMQLPVLLHYYGAHTGRWSGGNKLNLQNLQRGGALRRSLLAPKGMVVIAADSSQIEARVTAWLAGEASILEAFAKKEDLYRIMAGRIYGKHPDEVDDIERFVGKTCILGLGYGMGAAKLQATLALGSGGKTARLSLSECESIVRIYRSTYPKIVALWKDMDKILSSMLAGDGGSFRCISWGPNRVTLPNQMSLLYPVLQCNESGDITYKTRFGYTKIYGGLLTENVVQALARIIVAEQMLLIGERYDVVTMTHDEVVFLAPESEGQEAFDWGKKIMSTPPKWAAGIPLGASGGFDVCYSK